jgi:hypothetical protein
MASCLFCRRDEATVEHVIPKEMSRRLWEVSPFTPKHGAPLPRPAKALRFYHSKYVDLKVSAACKNCNGQYFNQLQLASRPFWHPAIGGEDVSLDTRLKRSVATWAYKTALLLPLPDRSRSEWEPSVGAFARDLRIQSRPPVGVRIWAGRYDLRDDFPEHVVIGRVGELHLASQGAEFVGVQILLTIGYLLFVVIYWPHDGPDGIRQENERFPSSHFLQLWPIYSGHDSVWPPSHLFKFSEIDPLMEKFGELEAR